MNTKMGQDVSLTIKVAKQGQDVSLTKLINKGLENATGIIEPNMHTAEMSTGFASNGKRGFNSALCRSAIQLDPQQCA